MTNLLLAIRPKTLTAALAPIIASAGYVLFFYNEINYYIFTLALASAIFIQIATNLFNDAIDFKKGADGADRLGPERVTQSGLMSSKQVFYWAAFFCVLAVLAGIPLVIHGGWPIVIIGIVSLVMAYAYTGGPYPLAYLGLGDVFVMIFFGWVAVQGMCYLQSGEWTSTSFALGTQIGAFGTVLIAINNLRDARQDREVGKLTLAARFGKTFTLIEILSLYYFAFVMQLVWFVNEAFFAAFFPLILLWPAFDLIKKIKETQPGPEYNKFLGLAAQLQLKFALLLLAGFLFDHMGWTISL
mgnify:CR=1 FL=1|tara:strand:- start:14112 stop:15008 length:897 start_codon:yes stop_codon:yes gene_type:complete